jgi:phosphoadenosine phosphosulfate reductase
MPSISIPSTLDTLHPADVLRWAANQFDVSQIVVTASFEDAVLTHLAATTLPGVEVVLLDTQYLFAETAWFAEQLRRRFDLNLRIVHPLPEVTPDNQWQHDTAGCCERRKVEPLQRALAGKQAWVTGVRRADSPSRADAPVAAFDIGRGLVKVNPLATLTDDDIDLYHELHDLPRNPLIERGYPSIGCWPCTLPVAPGEDRRAGRWAGSAKTECGLHA